MRRSTKLGIGALVATAVVSLFAYKSNSGADALEPVKNPTPVVEKRYKKSNRNLTPIEISAKIAEVAAGHYGNGIEMRSIDFGATQYDFDNDGEADRYFITNNGAVFYLPSSTIQPGNSQHWHDMDKKDLRKVKRIEDKIY